MCVCVFSVAPNQRKKERGSPRTIERHKTGHGLPHPPPPRVRANANEDSEQRRDSKPDCQLCRVPRARPRDAKGAVLLFAAVAHALGEIAAFERREDLLPVAARGGGRVGHPDDLAFAAFQETVMDDGAAV
jgi:hypothetical protein